jgi:hypothetical protein
LVIGDMGGCGSGVVVVAVAVVVAGIGMCKGKRIPRAY